MREGRLEYLQRDDREYLFDLEQDEGERADLAPARPPTSSGCERGTMRGSRR
jgi:hypothetical protein